MPTRRQLIQKITLNSTGGNIIFSNIPQNYTDLKIVVSARYALSGIPSIRMRFNSDSGNNYTNRIIEGSGSTVYSTTESSANNIFIGNVPGSATTSNTFCNIESYIPNYSSSNNKSVLSKSVTENNATTAYIDHAAGLWSNTAAINSINIYLTDLAANSTFYLYGITHVPIIRGGEEYVSGGFKYHKFTSTAALQVIEPGDVEALIVSGGGGGAHGGGGAGGLKLTRAGLSAGASSVTIGAGGTSTWYWVGGSANNGSSSSINAISSTGGGAGGNIEAAGGSGGSEGGGGGGPSASLSGGSAVSGEGNVGGTGGGYSNNQGAAGGGGAGAAGSPTAGAGIGGVGGSGRFIFGNHYSGGGGGGGNTLISGGVGGGGSGAGGSSGLPATAGLPNTGGGGGGCFGNGTSGGSGIVIIRYPYDGN